MLITIIIKTLFDQAGVTEDQLSQLEIYETIVNFIQVHGVDNVKKEVETAADVVDAAPADEALAAETDSSEKESAKGEKLNCAKKCSVYIFCCNLYR